MSVLVTGGCGFIGSWICKNLCNKKIDFVILDNMSGGFYHNIKEDFKLIVGDIRDAELIDSLFKKYKFTHVYHAAAYAAEGLSHWIRRYNYEVNVLGSINLINAAIKYKVERFVYFSSMAVYGTQQVPYTEDMKPKPEDPYGIAKYAVEQDLFAALKMFGLKFTIFRPHNIYGPFQNIWDTYRNVVGIFMRQYLEGKPLTIFGSGEQIRAFSYIDDIIEPLVSCVNYDTPVGHVYNIGGDEPISIYTLADLVGGVGCKRLHHRPRYEVRQAYCNHAKIRSHFGWFSSTAMDVGVNYMRMWAKQYLHKIKHVSEFYTLEQTENLPEKWIL